jgi:hypothetical protein
VQLKVEVPEPPVMLVALSVQDRLVELVTTVSVTVPLKPSSGATVIVEVPATPTVALTVAGVAVRVKSWTVNVTLALLVALPLVPVTVTV